MTTHTNNLDTSHEFDAYPAYRRLVSGSSKNRQMDIYLVCQQPSQAQKVFGLTLEALSQSELSTLVDCVSTSEYASSLAVRSSSFDMLDEKNKNKLTAACAGRVPTFGDTGTNLRIRLGEDNPYYRYWNDPDAGGVWNVPTFNRYNHLIAGGYTGRHKDFPEFSAEEASALLEDGKKSAQELFARGEGTDFRLEYSARQKKMEVIIIK